MTIREDVLTAARRLTVRGIVPFTPADVVREAHAAGSRYREASLRTHVVSYMCGNVDGNTPAGGTIWKGSTAVAIDWSIPGWRPGPSRHRPQRKTPTHRAPIHIRLVTTLRLHGTGKAMSRQPWCGTWRRKAGGSPGSLTPQPVNAAPTSRPTETVSASLSRSRATPQPCTNRERSSASRNRQRRRCKPVTGSRGLCSVAYCISVMQRIAPWCSRSRTLPPTGSWRGGRSHHA